ncbi:MAG TPA: hypothetical protein VF941_06785 [Clostridia bacterium]
MIDIDKTQNTEETAMTTLTWSHNIQKHLLNKRITELLEDIEKAESHIDLVRTIGERNAQNYYPKAHHRPVNHPRYGNVSPIYIEYLYYKKHLSSWKQELSDKYRQERNLKI